METKMKYLEDATLLESQARVVGVGTDERGQYLEFNETVFYPQGGGQPADKGSVECETWSASVVDVRFVEGTVRHYIGSPSAPPQVDDVVRLKVDEALRSLHRKAHTAGHLVQAVVEDMNVGLRALKGYHFPDGAYVQFSGPKPSSPDDFIKQSNERLQLVMAQRQMVSVRMVAADEIKSLCPDLPYALPEGKPLRVVKVGSVGGWVPCGGTHLDTTDELKTVEITKVKAKEGDVRLSYRFS